MSIASIRQPASAQLGDCEWLAAAATDGFLDRSTLQVQRTGADSWVMVGRDANTMIGAVVAVSRDAVISMI
ncbi:hypothetical protein GWG65_18340 [Bradyrhizobium sp. CSA207]|uniref:hypothetical protein n=1 Tax=Bradyrhizobium sp. CSA207 TaxID=2698826 RepID=UPI0023B13EA3|nr:hypothetical protein [Bradyrhizobium sp. CSA207]MDE5443367.1 hypothetical protein [Bradyrhizobium sp. CSA207]